jgi:ferredoxin
VSRIFGDQLTNILLIFDVVLALTFSMCYFKLPFHMTKDQAATVPITFVDPVGKEHEVQAEVGKHLLDVAHDNNIELEGACGGELACATCHLIFEKKIYDTLPEKLDEEDDMLDLAYELTDTSRLGCQITVREDFAGMKVTIPDDGF